MRKWRKERLTEGRCPSCATGLLVQGRNRCEHCLKQGAIYSRRWRTKNKAEYNAYMRQYMQARRALHALPQASQTPPNALLVRARELEHALGGAPSQG